MITIDRLRLTLPAGFDERGHTVARRVAEELAGLATGTESGPRRLTRLTVAPLTLDPALGDDQVARRIAHSIYERVTAPPPGAEGGGS